MKPKRPKSSRLATRAAAAAARAPSPKSSHDSPDLQSAFPTVARFVQGQGWIEIGDHEGEGWAVRALDYGGMIFESRKPKTLDEAMRALEKGIVKFLKEHG